MSHSPSSHDTGYKMLFSHPEMVRDLLTQYVPGPWLEHADFSSLERVNASYVSETEPVLHNFLLLGQPAQKAVNHDNRGN